MNYFEDGSHYEDVKSLKFKIWDDLTIKTEIISQALKEAYLWGREEAAREIEALDWHFDHDSVQQIVMPQVRDRCAAIARGDK